MGPLDLFALVILVVMVGLAAAVWALLALLPGRIAKQRGHAQAEAINVCGWWGAITLGLLLPVAWIWAFTKPATESSMDDVRAVTNPDDHDVMTEEQTLT